ncbi:MAG: hypothetical protein JSR72_05715 [Proteobacteria bacterium]|nr:hypothetical protein [Pseudomonadota bacterium]
MPTTRINPTHLSDIDRPTCRDCGSRMWLSRVSAPVQGRELRTFECPVCEVSTGNGRSDSDRTAPPI